MLHIITGGSGSGKSAYAEDRILDLSNSGKPRIYIATMYPFDEESQNRIKRHRIMRKDKGFETIECFTGLDKVQIPKGASVLLECMSNLVANEMYQDSGAGKKTVEAVLRGIEILEKKAEHLVIVTNEIFSDSSFYLQETVNYQKNLGKINQELATRAAQVTEVVYGIPVLLKGDKHEATIQ